MARNYYDNLNILYEDEYIIVIDKPANIASHNSTGWYGPSIVELFSVHVIPSKLFLVMEYLEGGELLNAICRKQRYAENDARIVMYQVASAIDYLHSKKINNIDLSLLHN
jgi:serine/threonine protein kinase